MLKISDLRNKDVINLKDGKRLGYISDVELDMENGVIQALIVPSGEHRIFGFRSREDETAIYWPQIRKIGEDVILVDPERRGKKSPPASPLPEQETELSITNAFDVDPEEETEDLFHL